MQRPLRPPLATFRMTFGSSKSLVPKRILFRTSLVSIDTGYNAKTLNFLKEKIFQVYPFLKSKANICIHNNKVNQSNNNFTQYWSEVC